MNHNLFAVIRDARRRWRLRLVLRGLAIVSGATLGLFLATTWILDRLRFDATAVLVLGMLAWVAVAFLAWRYLVRPLARQVTDEQVALYLEEHEPGFEGHLLSAVEFSGRVDGLTSRPLVDRLVQGAVARCASLNAWRELERPGIRRASGALAGTALAGLAVLVLSPGFVGFGAPFLLKPFGGPADGSPYAIAVTPGDTLIARGADLPVTALLRNFEAETVELALRRGEGEWEHWPMPPDEASGRRALLVFAMDSQATYYVEAAGVRSPVYTVRVEDLPYVKGAEVEYHFPAYTGLSPRREEGGDIAALAGTRVIIRVIPTLPTSAGRIITSVSNSAAAADTLDLIRGSNDTLHATLTVTEEGSYRVLFPAPDGGLVVGSPDYYIDVLEDQPPLVRFRQPGRDLDVTSIEEVFLEAEAEDDFGVGRLELVYRVNGGDERTAGLYGPGARREVAAGHTLLLEEFGLQPGDFVSYYARATDARPGAEPALTDIYFLSIRPFDRSFREAEQQGEMMAGQGAMGVGELSERQRQIVAATFKMVRDRRKFSDEEHRDHMTTLALAQGRLREDVEVLERRISSRGVVALDSTMAPVAEALPQAVAAMREAENDLGRGAPDDALAPEQRALQHLQRAEAIFRREQQVTRGQQSGNRGGGNPLSDELSELFELEADRMRNQYEQADRDVREQTNQQIDETLEKLRELARRQQQQEERRRALERQGGAGTGTPSDQQRQLAQEAEESARRLERLSREQSRPDLAEAARRIREAADAMRRAAAGRDDAAMGAATERLREAQRRLEQSRSSGLDQDVQDALARARRLEAQQDEVQRDVAGLDAASARERQSRVEQLGQRKDLMAQEVGELEDQLERLSREAQADQPDAAARLRAAARGIRQTRLEDKIRYSRGVVAERETDYARNFEESIGADLDSLRSRIEDAAAALGESPEEQLEQTLDRTRDLAGALESLRERLESGRATDSGGPADPRTGGRDTTGGRGDGRTGGRLNPDDARQMARELGERRRELGDIRDQLRRQGIDAGELDDLMRAMGRYDNPNQIGTPRALDDLARLIVPGLKEFEFGLRRALLESRTGVTGAAAVDRVAPEYREMVEEYYRKLGRNRR